MRFGDYALPLVRFEDYAPPLVRFGDYAFPLVRFEDYALPLVRFGDYAFPLRGKVPNEGRRKRGVPHTLLFLWHRVLCYAIIEGKISGNEGELCRKRAATAAASRAMKRR